MHREGGCDVEMNKPLNQVGVVCVHISCLHRHVKVDSFDV